MFNTEGTEATQRGTEVFGKELSGEIIGCAMEVHSSLGPGLLESVYEECLCHELNRASLSFRRQVESPVHYRGLALATSLRVDLLVEETAIVEVKAVETILKLHQSQLLTYLRLTKKRLGLLINFNVGHLRDGICRKII